MKQRVEIARTLGAQYPVRTLCRLLGIGRSSVLYEGKQKQDHEELKRAIFFFLNAKPDAGVRYMYEMLRRHQVECSRAQVRRIYEEEGLLGKKPQKRLVCTDSRHGHPVYPDLVKGLEITGPDHVWATDVTFLRVRRHWAYLDLLLDVFSREIVGWSVGGSNDALLCSFALEGALLHRKPEIHHSDQGRPYASKLYTGLLEKNGIRISMSRSGSPWDNGHAERMNKTFKYEEAFRNEYRTIAEAREAVASFVELYNHGRIHSSLDYYTPAEFCEMHKPLEG